MKWNPNEPLTFNPSIHTFWMVYKINGSHPTAIHSSYESAAAEATRLAKANPLHEFVVLESKKKFGVSGPPVTEMEY